MSLGNGNKTHIQRGTQNETKFTHSTPSSTPQRRPNGYDILYHNVYEYAQTDRQTDMYAYT